MLTDSQIEELKKAAEVAGKIILDYQSRQNFKIEYKHFNDPVTTADLEANKILTNAIQKLFPDDLIVSEETYTKHFIKEIDQSRLRSKRIWIIDPLDGTKEFIKGLPLYAISIGFLLNNQPHFGIIFNPARNFFLYGGKDYGVFLNNRKLEHQPRIIDSLQSMRICISTSEIKQNLFSDILGIMPEDNIEIIGSVAYKLGLVATGEFDLILSKKPKADWDIAGGLAILGYNHTYQLDMNFTPIQLNKKSMLTPGLIIGSKKAVELYQSFVNH